MKLSTFLLALLGLTAHTFAKKWHRYSFPNPREDVNLCGRGGNVSYICDPDGLLDFSQANQLDRMIEHVIRNTRCPCAKESCDKGVKGYKIGIALVDKIRTDAEAKGEAESQNVNVVEIALDESKKFAYTQRIEWELGTCGEDLIIFYSKSDSVLFTITGETTSKKLRHNFIGEIAMTHRKLFNQKDTYYQGLKNLINDYRDVFDGKYKQKFNVQKGPQYQAVIGSSSSAILPGLLTSIIMTIVVILLH